MFILVFYMGSHIDRTGLYLMVLGTLILSCNNMCNIKKIEENTNDLSMALSSESNTLRVRDVIGESEPETFYENPEGVRFYYKIDGKSVENYFLDLGRDSIPHGGIR